MMLQNLANEITAVVVDHPDCGLGNSDAILLQKIVLTAKKHAEALTSLLDGQEDDELGRLLAPIRDFLIELSAE